VIHPLQTFALVIRIRGRISPFDACTLSWGPSCLDLSPERRPNPSSVVWSDSKLDDTRPVLDLVQIRVEKCLVGSEKWEQVGSRGALVHDCTFRRLQQCWIVINTH
jgi:hypothetical protein